MPMFLDSQESAINAETDFGINTVRGWPFQFIESYEGPNSLGDAESYVRNTEGGEGVQLLPLFANGVIALFGLIIVAFLSETIISRPEGSNRGCD